MVVYVSVLSFSVVNMLINQSGSYELCTVCFQLYSALWIPSKPLKLTTFHSWWSAWTLLCDIKYSADETSSKFRPLCPILDSPLMWIRSKTLSSFIKNESFPTSKRKMCVFNLKCRYIQGTCKADQTFHGLLNNWGFSVAKNHEYLRKYKLTDHKLTT